LGDPEELAQGFLETLEPEELERYRKRKKFLLRGCVAALVVVLVAMTCWAVNLRNEPNLVEITGVITIHE
jgi:flagellar biosynthesis/type III secretory pathway M-ring protein FliF/YscJ